MARQVHEIMSRELFSLAPGDDVAAAAESILGLGVTAAPVLDAARRPLGVASLRDLIETDRGGTVAERMSRPALTVRQDATIEVAGKRLADGNVHRLVVVDADGRAVGMVSAVDLVRALLGLPVPHPAALPHLDLATGLSWTDDTTLEADRVGVAPDGPGIFVLVHGEVGQAERMVWVEASPNVRTRLSELVAVPQEEPELRRLLERELAHLRFRATPVQDGARRDAMAAKLREHVEHGAPR